MNNTIPFHSAPHAPQITVDVNILSMLKQAASCLTEMVSENVYLAAIGPDMELQTCPTYIPTGSPPRMRGKLSCRKTYTLSRGITPADAGKTSTCLRWTGCCRDHPRGCGENIQHAQAIIICAGSPPRMRGKPAKRKKRIIQSQDHPRGCGENRINRVRCAYSRRITPADAGKTLKRSFRNQPFCS